MPEEIRLWEVRDQESLAEVSKARLDAEKRIELWIEKDIKVLRPDVMVIGRQVATAYGKFIDILCMDGSGNLVIVELKRDKTPP